MVNFYETAKRALDALAGATGLRLVPDPLLHPGGKNVCILDLQGYRQVESYTCGFVAGAMILHTFHPDASLTKFFEQCSPDPETGLQDARLVRSLRANGVGVGHRRDLTFERIAATLEQGFPIITLTKTEEPGVQHWVVIYGYGRRPNRVFIAGEGLPIINNLTGQKEIAWPRFSRSKWANRGFGLVCWGK